MRIFKMRISVGALAIMVIIIGLLLIGFGVNKAAAQDQNAPSETSLVEPIDVEDIYLRLKVDWSDKDDITHEASMACFNFTGETKVKCYKEQKYFEKRQISGFALTLFTNFKYARELY